MQIRGVAAVAVNFINILLERFSQTAFWQKITKPKCNKRKDARSTFVQKMLKLNVDEIDACNHKRNFFDDFCKNACH